MARLKVGVRMLAGVGMVALLTSGFAPFVSAQEQARIDAQSKIGAELKLEAENASATEKSRYTFGQRISTTRKWKLK